MAEPTDDKKSELDARSGAAAGGFGVPELSIVLPGVGSKFPAEEVPAVAGPPPQTQYDTSLPPVGPKRDADLLTAAVSGNPLASEVAAASPVLSPPAASLTLSPTTPVVEIASAFEAIQERIRVLEIRMPPPPAGLGHNNPPEPIEGVPFSAAEWAEMRGLLAVLKEQAVVPAHEPKEAEAAASRLQMIGEKILSFLGRHGDEFSSAFAKTAGTMAVPWVMYELAHYGEASLKAFATDLIEVHNLVEAWVHLLGF